MIFFFYGEPDLTSLKAEEVIERLKKESTSPFKVQKISLEEEKIDYFLLQPAISLFGNKEVIVINQGEKLNKEEVKSLTQIYRDSKEKHLIILANELKPSHALLKTEFLKSCYKAQKIVFSEALMRKKIKAEFRKEGKQASETLVQALISLYGNNFSLVRQEIKKIVIYFANQTQIKSKELKALLSENPEDLSFKFFKVISQRDKKRAFKLLPKLVTHQSEVTLFLSRFLSRLRLWLKVKAFTVEGIVDPKLIAKKLGFNPYYVNHLLNESSNFSFLELEKALLEGLRLDYLLKTGKIAPLAVPAILLGKIFRLERQQEKVD